MGVETCLSEDCNGIYFKGAYKTVLDHDGIHTMIMNAKAIIPFNLETKSQSWHQLLWVFGSDSATEYFGCSMKSGGKVRNKDNFHSYSFYSESMSSF